MDLIQFVLKMISNSNVHFTPALESWSAAQCAIPYRTHTIGAGFHFGILSQAVSVGCVLSCRANFKIHCVFRNQGEMRIVSSELHCNFTGLLVFGLYELYAVFISMDFGCEQKWKVKQQQQWLAFHPKWNESKEKYENTKRVKEAKCFIVYWIELMVLKVGVKMLLQQWYWW